MIMEKEKEMRIAGKLTYFLEKNCKVHVKRVDKTFWNGYIVDRETDGVFVMEEDKLGRMALFVLDVYDVSEYKGGKE